ncbi:MAG TPA: TonB-dependent receptor [Caulobacteraceae bacterium]|nr:TonB-dependent receptor [Caulobacteraceae bacterium]
MRHLGRTARARLLAGAAAGILAISAGAAHAQDREPITIQPQPLESALYDFGGQTGLQVLFAPGLALSKRTAGVAGETDVQLAMSRLLQGTGLSYRRDGDMFVIVQAGEGGSPQDAGAAGGGAEVEELIVTAQKKEEAIQDVPIAISAFSMETLDEQKIEGGFDLLKAIPNVTFSKTNFSGYNFQIRGIGTQAISATTDPAVAVSFNNTTLIVNRLFEQEYLDIERVEVLRGPQGTLYGRNATSGVINVISAKPVIGDFFGEAKVEVGNFNARRFRSHINIPLGEQFAVRGAFASTKRDGYGYNEYDGSDVDDRDLWTGRVTLGWEPTPYFRANLLWEHFEEDDQRVRTSKQLCTRDTGTVLTNWDGSFTDARDYFHSALSQGCKAGSLYADEAYGTPNGASLPYLSALYWGSFYTSSGLGAFASLEPAYGLGGSPYFAYPGDFFTPPVIPTKEARCLAEQQMPALMPVQLCNPDVFGGLMQSRDLRTISSQLEPKYRAKSDVFDLSFDLDLTENLTFSSQTVYAKDEVYATQDYNRFTAFPIWSDSLEACGTSLSLFLMVIPNCTNDPNNGIGTFAPLRDENGNFIRDEDGRRVGFYRDLSPGGIVCDPQLGCSDTLLIQDLSQAESKQFNQEFRIASAYDGPWNFSLGTNFTRFETQNDYYVFSNALTHLLNFFPFNTPFGPCATTGDFCRYVDPNPLESINGEGHNYFRSDNPYKLTSAAVFGEVYWEITPTVQLTAGARFTWDRKVFTPVPSQLLLGDYREAATIDPGDGPEQCTEIRIVCPLAGTAVGGRGSPAGPDIVQDWREPTGRLVLDWKPELGFTDDTMIYASISRGYKGGGANPPSVAPPAKFMFDRASGGTPDLFAAEYINAYEVGSKNTLLEGALMLNGAAFFYDYTDYQVSKILDRRAVNENFDAKVWGAELELVFSPTRNLRFNGAFGYLRTEIADGERSIDLMDRTDGGNRLFANPNGDFPEGFDKWVVIQPWITAASNCIVPLALLQANASDSSQHFINAFCPTGNVAGGSSKSGVSYFDADGNFVHMSASEAAGRRIYDPAVDAPNGGAGFFKDLSGNELPNAPRFTASVGAQYRMELPGGWDATLRGDFYWQDKSFARVYNMSDYDRLKAWTNTNVSLWVENATWGVKAEVYVKNAFDETPITGAFLNSDDSGLTTNVFTLDPRLVGVSVTKEF